MNSRILFVMNLKRNKKNIKMSEANYQKFKWFYDYTLENATDADMEIIFTAISFAAKKMSEKIHAQEESEPKIEKENKEKTSD